MVSGNFTNDKDGLLQIAVSCDDGILYIMEDYEIVRLLSLGTCITKVEKYQKDGKDLLLCIGHFNELIVISGNEIVQRVKTNDWIHLLTVGDIDNDGNDEVIIGMLDHTMQVLKMK